MVFSGLWRGQSRKVRRQRPRRRSRWTTCLYLERLEDRLAPATVHWTNPAGGAWDDPHNWDAGRLPGPGDDAVIPLFTGNVTITHTTGNHAVNSLQSKEKLLLSGGSITVTAAATINNDLTLRGGTLTGTGNITVTGLTTWDSGTIGAQAKAKTITTEGGLALGNGAKVLDQRALSAPGPVTWTGGDVVLQNGATWGIAPNRPDLAPYAVLKVSGVTAPSLTIGEHASVTVSWTVTNMGAGPGVTRKWADEVVATTDATLGNPDHEIVLDRFTHDGFLAQNDSYSPRETFNLPLVVQNNFAQPLHGRYHLFVRSDADNEVFMNQQRVDAIAQASNPFGVSPKPYADLVVTNVEVPLSGQTNQPLHIRWQVVNQGIATTDRADWSDTISLATDSAGTNLVKQFQPASFSHVGALAVNEGYWRSADVTLPPGLPDGAYYVVVETATRDGPYQFNRIDPQGKSSDNAIAVTPGPSPHLVIDPAMGLPDLPVLAGTQIDVSWTDRNDGNADATAGRMDQLQLEKVGSFGSLYLGYFQDSSILQAGKSSTRTAHVIVPVGAQGLYRLAVSSSSGSQSTTAHSVATLRVDAKATANLQVTSLTTPTTVYAGQRIAADFTVSNLGQAPTESSWTDTVYLSLSNDTASGAIVAASLTNQSALGAGESYQVHTASFTVPLDFGGRAYVLARTGIGATLSTFSRPIDVIPVSPADLVVSDVEAPTQASTGSTIKVHYKVTNRGLGPTDMADWNDEIWLAHAPTRPDQRRPREDRVLKDVPHHGVLQVGESYIGEVEVPIPVGGTSRSFPPASISSRSRPIPATRLPSKCSTATSTRTTHTR